MEEWKQLPDETPSGLLIASPEVPQGVLQSIAHVPKGLHYSRQLSLSPTEVESEYIAVETQSQKYAFTYNHAEKKIVCNDLGYTVDIGAVPTPAFAKWFTDIHTSSSRFYGSTFLLGIEVTYPQLIRDYSIEELTRRHNTDRESASYFSELDEWQSFASSNTQSYPIWFLVWLFYDICKKQVDGSRRNRKDSFKPIPFLGDIVERAYANFMNKPKTCDTPFEAYSRLLFEEYVSWTNTYASFSHRPNTDVPHLAGYHWMSILHYHPESVRHVKLLSQIKKGWCILDPNRRHDYAQKNIYFLTQTNPTKKSADVVPLLIIYNENNKVTEIRGSDLKQDVKPEFLRAVLPLQDEVAADVMSNIPEACRNIQDIYEIYDTVLTGGNLTEYQMNFIFERRPSDTQTFRDGLASYHHIIFKTRTILSILEQYKQLTGEEIAYPQLHIIGNHNVSEYKTCIEIDGNVYLQKGIQLTKLRHVTGNIVVQHRSQVPEKITVKGSLYVCK